MIYQKFISAILLGILITIPLIFGAVHPIVRGVYVAVLLVGCGGWLLVNKDIKLPSITSFWILAPLFLIAYIILQSIPLPLWFIDIVSPARAGRVEVVNTLASTDIKWTTISDNGIIGFYRSFFLFGLILYYLSLTSLLENNRKFITTLIFVLIAVGTFEAVYGILQFLKPQLGILWLSIKSRAAYGTIIYKNQYASFLNMIWPLAVTGGALYLIKKKNRKRDDGQSSVKKTVDSFTTTKIQAPLFLFAAGLMILAVLFSLSRGGILSMMAVGLLLVWMLSFSRKGKLIFLSLFGLVIAGYITLLGFDTLVARFGSLGKSGSGRMDIYINSIPMFLENWTTGIGLGSYNLLSPIYLKGFPATVHFDRAHNEYLELAIELGAPCAIILFCWIGGGMLKLFVRLTGSMKYNPANRDMNAIGAAAFAGLCGFLLHGVADFGWRLPVNLVYAVTLLSLLTVCLKPSRTFKNIAEGR